MISTDAISEEKNSSNSSQEYFEKHLNGGAAFLTRPPGVSNTEKNHFDNEWRFFWQRFIRVV